MARQSFGGCFLPFPVGLTRGGGKQAAYLDLNKNLWLAGLALLAPWLPCPWGALIPATDSGPVLGGGGWAPRLR